MSSKDPGTGKAAKDGAANNFKADAMPDAKADPVLPCKTCHWLGVRVVNDKGKPVAGVKMKLTLTDGTTPVVTSDKNGKFATKKVLSPGTCTIAMPDLFDAEWKEQA